MAKLSSFEEKLLGISSEEALKGAKQLLKSNSLNSVYRDRDNALNAVFEGKNSCIRTRVITGDDTQFDCSCPHDKSDGKLCEHAVASIMYSSRFNREIQPIDDDEAVYAGMKQSKLMNLKRDKSKKLSAQLFITVMSEFPHVPSKWENAVLNVKLVTKEREYLGNLNNLKQLFMNKSLIITLKLESFSLQDQQIIRYLALHGEAENSNILLNSEDTAEFFHCLIGFERFFKDGRRVIVHPEYAEAVILKKESKNSTLLSPAIRVGEAVLDLGHSKVITGRAGCWVGRQGEYYFVPGKLDISWIRTFFRSGRQEVPDKIPECLFDDNGDFPVPVIGVETLELEKLEHKILMSGRIADDNSLRIELNYIYKNHSFPANSGRLAVIDNKFYRRDEEAEREFEKELEMFGFVKESGYLVLKNSESIGTFFDRMIALYSEYKENVIFDSFLSRLSCGGHGVNALSIATELSKFNGINYTINYKFSGNGLNLDYKMLLKNAEANRKYLILKNREIIKLTDDMKKFIIALNNVAENIDDKKHTFELPHFSVAYYTKIGENIVGAVPKELLCNTAINNFDDTQKNFNLLNDMNLSPTFGTPDFKFTGELRKYQREGVDFMKRMSANNLNVIMADEMGLGKTIQVLAMLAEMQKKSDKPSLVICPASLLTNWEREAAKFVPDMNVIQLGCSNRDRYWDKIEKYDLVIISYAVCRLDIDKIRQNEFNYVILDEAQHIKNPGTVNALNCKAIYSKHRIVLTGTPLENSTEDLWSIFDFLHHGMLGNFNSFKRYYSNIDENSELQNDLMMRVAPFIKRRTKNEVAKELPPKQEITLYCEMDSEQRKLYETIRKHGNSILAKMTNDKSGNVNTEIFTTLLRLRQICCHPQLVPGQEKNECGSAKMELMQELLHENIDCGHKVLLFSQFTSVLAVIEKHLKQNGIKYEYLDGTTRNRQSHVDNFNNNPDIKVFLLSLKAGGTGLNLTSADTVIIYDPWWNPAIEMQATDRTHRIGQTKMVNSMKLLVKDSIEEKIFQLQEKKQQIFDSIIDNPNAVKEKFSIEELKFLLQ
ncbi:MAG: DEAD/DEAH box helicase [Lentisphaeria bacterium]|nr:DEAD/DEAH box helicase [Lentisphaeria bacterium]